MAKPSLKERLNGCKNPLVAKLFKIMLNKKTNLCVAADGMDMDKLRRLIEQIGDHICMLKIHCEQIPDDIGHSSIMRTLFELKKKHDFLLFEDRKYIDGGETVRLSYETRFARYVDVVTVLPDGGDAIFQAIESGARNVMPLEGEPRGCLAVCEMSFSGVDRPDGEKWLEIVERNSPTCIGIIGQKLELNDPYNMIKATPGVNLSEKTDGSNQNWRTPNEAMRDGADVLIVGRAITSAPEDQWAQLAREYARFVELE